MLFESGFCRCSFHFRERALWSIRYGREQRRRKLQPTTEDYTQFRWQVKMCCRTMCLHVGILLLNIQPPGTLMASQVAFLSVLCRYNNIEFNINSNRWNFINKYIRIVDINGLCPSFAKSR